MPISITTTGQVPKKRLVSLDALRGFDMFWIIGARAIADGLVNLKLPGVSAFANQLYHTEWNGFTFYDLIFPLFIFISGVSLVLSLEKRIKRGDRKWDILKHVIIRSVTLFILGIVYNGISGEPVLSSIRIMGVLQRSALCYFFASVLVIYTKPRTQAMTVVGLLVGYWAVMRFVPVPGFGPGVWTPEGNLAHYFDSLIIPGRLYNGTWDPEGLVSTIPAIASCLLGSLTGYWMRADQWRGKILTEKQRTFYLLAAGTILIFIGLCANLVFPINKNLWTSSFVLLTAGLSIILFAIFYWLIDVRSYQRFAFPFIVVGMNSLFIYLLARFIPFDQIARLLTGGDLLAFWQGQHLLVALAQLLLEGLVLLWLYNRRTFIRI